MRLSRELANRVLQTVVAAIDTHAIVCGEGGCGAHERGQARLQAVATLTGSSS